MEIKVINIYPKPDKISGTAHIRILPLNIDIKGVYYTSKKGKLEVYPPAFHYEESDMRVENFSFADPAINKAFKSQLHQAIEEALDPPIAKLLNTINKECPPDVAILIKKLMEEIHSLQNRIKKAEDTLFGVTSS